MMAGKAGRKALALFLLTAMLSAVLSGCWNRRELDSFAIVLGLGVDNGEARKLNITAQIIKTQQREKSSGDGQGGNFLNVSNDGETVLSTLRGFTRTLSRKLYIAHNRLIIIGREHAMSGVRDTFDLFARDGEGRLSVLVCMADGRADELLSVEPQLEQSPVMEMVNLIEEEPLNGEIIQVRIFDFLYGLVQGSVSSVLPIIKVSGEGEEKKLMISGTAVFKGDRLVGELNRCETRGYLHLLGKTSSGMLVCDMPDGNHVVYELISLQSKLEPVYTEDGRYVMRARIHSKGRIGGQEGVENYGESKHLNDLQTAVEKVIEKDIMEAFERAVQLGTDIYKFGEMFYRKYPDIWEAEGDNWDKLFKTMELDLEIQSEISAFGGLNKPFYSEKGYQHGN